MVVGRENAVKRAEFIYPLHLPALHVAYWLALGAFWGLAIGLWVVTIADVVRLFW